MDKNCDNPCEKWQIRKHNQTGSLEIELHTDEKL